MERDHAFGRSDRRAIDRIRSLLLGVQAADAQELGNAARERRLWPGSFMLRQGDLEGRVFIVDRGAVKLSSIALDGRRFVHRIVGPGEAFGWISMLARDEGVSEVVAIVHSILIAIPDRTVATVAARSPPVALTLARWSAEEARRCRVALEAAHQEDVTSRLATALCDLADRFGMHTLEGTLIDLPVVQQDLAELVGSSRETVCKAMAGFRREGWIRSIDNRLVVNLPVDRAGLSDERSRSIETARSAAW